MVEGVAYCRMLFDDAGAPADFIYEDVNPAFESLTGLRESIGRRVTELVPGIREANPELFEVYGRVTRTGIPEQFESYVAGLERWFTVRAFRLKPGHFAAVFENITERKVREQELRASEARMRGSLDLMLDPFLVCSAVRAGDGTITGFRAVFANRAAEAFMGQMPNTLSGASMPDGMPYPGAEPFFETFRTVVETGETWAENSVESMVPGPDGTRRKGVIDIQVARFEEGFFATWRDVTDRVSAAEALLLSEHRFRQFFERTPDYVYTVSLDGHVLDANPAALEALGYAHDDLVGQSIEIIYAPEDRRRMAGLFERWTEVGPITNLEQELVTRTGARRTVLLSASMVRDGGRRPLYFLGVQRDITELREAQADAELEVRFRAALAESVQSVREGASVEEAAQAICDRLVTLAYVDTATVQVFLGARDVQIMAQSAPPGYPVPVGTLLPAGRAAIVRERARIGPWAEYVSDDPADGWMPGTVASGLKALAFGPIARGDHVEGALLIGTLDERFARTLVDKMPGIVSLSTTLSALLAGRLQTISARAELHETLAAILAARAFHPVFQPIVDLETREVVGYEALTRFDSGQRPDLCFADAWAVGLGPEMELATLEAAVESGRRLAPGLWLDLNVSPRLLADPGRLRPILWAAERPLVLEVTEHEVIDDYDVVREAIRELGRDIRLAVDDAGAGVANFGHIIDLRPDFVKLDISMVRRVNANLGRQAMVVGMRHFSRTAGCRLIAEGVETAEEARTLTALGVEFAQGYHFGYPEPVEVWAVETEARTAREPGP